MSRVAALTLTLSLSSLTTVSAQELAPLVNHAVVPAPTAAPMVELPRVDERGRAAVPAPPARGTRDLPGLTEPFRQFPNDLRRFFSSDTFKVVGIGGVAALAATRVDGQTVLEARQRLQPARRFSTGNVGGGFFVQTGAAVATLAIGKALGESRLTYLGSDLVRAQLVSQTLVQGLKFTTGRSRPDGSNTQSFPSGHTASAAATASVLQRHFGWKAGVPAYGFAAYVAASRMSADKHHLSDVLMGAAIGIAAGRTVTVGLAGEKFDLGVAPTVGGAAITFTRR
jgi:membrane-associated phospholipid phosphatase